MFHEFGHMMHAILGGQQHWVLFSGVATEADFVEAPSQMFEEWAWDPAVLATFAKHDTTHQPIPADLVKKMRHAHEFAKGSDARQQMFYAALSLKLHQEADPSTIDFAAYTRTVQSKYGLFPFVDGTHFYDNFGHLNGYAASYYTYMWSLVIAKDMFSQFDRSRLLTYPTAVLAVSLGATLWAGTLGGGFIWIALIAAFINAAVAGKHVAAAASLLIGYLASYWPPWLIGTSGHLSAGMALGVAAWLLVLLAIAELIRIRNQRAAAQRRSQEEEYRRRASEDRVRIARDLHDVLAHNISVINVQSNTALHLMDRQPERAREALTAIHSVSKQALAELRSVLGVLREDAGPDGAPRLPGPGLALLPDLITAARASGLDVRLSIDGDQRVLLAGRTSPLTASSRSRSPTSGGTARPAPPWSGSNTRRMASLSPSRMTARPRARPRSAAPAALASAWASPGWPAGSAS